MKIDTEKELYCRDKDDGGIYKVTAIFFPLGKLSGKDITIEVGDIDEWRSIDDIELISNIP